MKKSFLIMALPAVALMFSFSVSAQQSAKADAVTEEVAYELPAMVTEKTIPFFDDAFTFMQGVKVDFYCYNLNLIVLIVDRSVQKDNSAIEQKIHSIFNTTAETLSLQPKDSFHKSNYMVMCNERDLIMR